MDIQTGRHFVIVRPVVRNLEMGTQSEISVLVQIEGAQAKLFQLKTSENVIIYKSRLKTEFKLQALYLILNR